MPRPVRSILPPVAALAIPLFAFTLATPGGLSSSLAAEECLAAPKPPAPQGSHWYYRTDRATGRKCWYLAEKNKKVQAATPRAAPREEPAEPAPQAQPAAPEPVAEAQPIESLTPVTPPPQVPSLPATTADTPQWPDPPTGTIEREAGETRAPGGQAGLIKDAPAPVASVERPLPVVADTVASVPSVALMAMLLFLAGALVGTGFLMRAIFRAAAARRRWAEFDRYHAHLGAEVSPPVRSKVDSRRGAMEFPPVPPIESRRRDDVEEALQRLRARKRAA